MPAAPLPPDSNGDVYVFWHAPIVRQGGQQAARADSQSEDYGRTFVREAVAFDPATGACGCCGTRAYARGGTVDWQIYDQDGRAESALGMADGVPTWSLVAAPQNRTAASRSFINRRD